MHGGDVVVAETHARERAALEVLGDDVELRRQIEDELLALRGLEIDADRLLVEVVPKIGRADRSTLGIEDRGLRTAAQIATLHALDLDHIGTQSGQQLGGVGECLHLLECEDAHAIEGLAVLDGIGVGDRSEFHGADPTGSGGTTPRPDQSGETSTTIPHPASQRRQ